MIQPSSHAALILPAIRQLSSVELLETVLQAAKTVDRPQDLATIWTAESNEVMQDGE